jgi:serine/threonine-protein kinase RsbW
VNTAHSMPSAALNRVMPSRLEEVEGVCREVRALGKEHGPNSVVFGLELTLRECLNNAIIHGNRRDPAKRVALDLLWRPKWIWVRVTDEGPGFDWRSVRQKPLADSTATSGRGLSIAAGYAQRVRFNPSGNQITLWFRNDSKPKCSKV